MPRGRLIFPFLAEIARLDIAGTAADPDGAGAETSGYDPDFREPIILAPASGSARGVEQRKELPLIRLPCQVEVGAFEAMQQMLSGQSPDGRIVLVFHFRDLENEGLVDALTGDALLRLNDRLVAIYTMAGALAQKVHTPPGLYVTNVMPTAFGIGRQRNLLALTFEDREVSIRTSARGG